MRLLMGLRDFIVSRLLYADIQRMGCFYTPRKKKKKIKT